MSAVARAVRKSLDMFKIDTIVEVDDSPNSDIVEFEGSLPEFKIILDKMATELNVDGLDRIRRVLYGMWFVHMTSMILIVWLSFSSDNSSDRLGLLMIVIQLYFAKILKSLNQMYDKIMAIQTDSKSIQEDIVEISKIHREKKKDYVDILTSKNYIMVVSDLEHRFRTLATCILKDLRIYTDSLRTLSLIVNSFFWKSPYYIKYLGRDAVEEAVRIINRHTERKVKKCIENQKNEENEKLKEAALEIERRFTAAT